MKFSAKCWIFNSVIAALTATEVTLRLAFGLGSPVLSQADPATGYRFQPNQKVFRFGKKIEYNQYSQRSEPITPGKPEGKMRILMTGDSVLNGGNPTDQGQTISELLKVKLSASGHPSEVLNASAGSWGIGNQLGYLRKFGTFQSNAVVLQIGSHDLTQPTSTSAPVGHDPNYPTHPPLSAIQEALTRYALPKLLGVFRLSSSPTEVLPPSSAAADRQFKQNMESFKTIVVLVRAEKVPVFVVFTPNREDLVPSPHLPPYKSQFFQLLNYLQVPVLDTHTTWSTLPTAIVENYFRDDVHLSVSGNQAAADLLFQQLCVARQLPACRTSVKVTL